MSKEMRLWAGLALVMVPLLTRATCVLNLFPGWDSDPLLLGGLDTGLSPGGSMVCDVLVLLGATLLFWHMHACGTAASVLTLVLASVGSAGVLLHCFGDGGIGHARAGLPWVSGVFAGLGVMTACHDARVRRVTIGLFCGVLALLAMRGVVEVFVDHPRTMAMFAQDKARMLASHGWAEGSSMALGFERRLVQPEASGWFGLSNVYASFAAAGTVLGVGLGVGLIDAWLKRPTGVAPRSTGVHALAFPAAGLSAAAMVYLAQSKGGLIATLGGVCALALLLVLRKAPEARARKLGGLVGLSAVVGAIALIAARWIVGDRVGELSMLFRGYYAQAALRMFAQHPLTGVGPNGFQQAYALAKNPLSPEDPTSPHIVVLDYLAGIGVLGIAWVVLVLLAAWASGAAVWSREDRSPDGTTKEPETRWEFRAALFIPAMATIVATMLQGAVVSPEIAGVRFLGLIAWGGIAWGVCVTLRRGLNVSTAVAGAALTLLAHAQIDVGGSWSQSCGLIAVIVGVACGGRGIRERVRIGGSAGILAACVAFVLSILAGVCASRALQWESCLIAARNELAPIVDIGMELELAREKQGEPGGQQAAARHTESAVAILAQTLGKTAPRTPEAFDAMMSDLEARLIPRAVDGLLRADAVDRGDPRARREASRLLVRQSEQLRRLGTEASSLEATTRALNVLDSPKPTAGEWHTRAMVHERRGELQDAGACLERALELDPYNLDFAIRRLKLAIKLQGNDVRVWAEKCRTLDGYMKHDRAVRGLNAEDRAVVERALGA